MDKKLKDKQYFKNYKLKNVNILYIHINRLR